VADCGASFSQLANYLRHARELHPHEPIQLVSCHKCDQDFSSAQQLESHLDDTHEDEEEEEDLLGESFSEEQEPDVNALNVAGFVCKMTNCRSLAFQRRSDLRRHYICEHNDTLVTCSKCNRRFSDQESLKEHLMERHGGAGVEPVACPFCGSEFLLKHLFKIHLLSQHPRPWSCPTCHQLTGTVAAANKHKILHMPKVTKQHF
jgi:uncharacterized Zn-finger protein